jgi:hypothetical protein
VPRAALFLAGLWAGGLLASWVVATMNFRTVDRVLGPDARPELRSRLGSVPAAEQRVVLRHLASEVNRWIFRNWALAQLAFGVALAAATWSVGGALRVLALAALVIVAVQALALGPPIVDLGRAIDFVPRPLPPDQARRFGMLHGAFVLLDLAKAAFLAATAWLSAAR